MSRRRAGFDAASLAAGMVVIALGTVLLLETVEVIDLTFGYLWPLLAAAAGAVLLAAGLADRRRG